MQDTLSAMCESEFELKNSTSLTIHPSEVSSWRSMLHQFKLLVPKRGSHRLLDFFSSFCQALTACSTPVKVRASRELLLSHLHSIRTQSLNAVLPPTAVDPGPLGFFTSSGRCKYAAYEHQHSRQRGES